MMCLRLREDIAVKMQERACEFHGPIPAKVLNLNVDQQALVERLGTGIPVRDLKDLVGDQKTLLKQLFRRGLIIACRSNADRNGMWISHFSGDTRKIQKTLSEKGVLIIGCGGTGSIIADHLARSGIKHFILVDPATVDEPDLNRQLPYTKRDLHRLKVDALGDYLVRNFDSECQQFAFALGPRTSIANFNSFDIVINCADKPKYEIEQSCLRLAIEADRPILFGSVGIRDYIVGPLLITQESKRSYSQRMERLQDEFPSTRVMKGSICYINSLASVEIGLVAFKFLSGIEDTLEVTNQLAIVDVFSHKRSYIDVMEPGEGYAASIRNE